MESNQPTHNPEPTPSPQATGPIAWMCRNHVVSNLLMLALVVGGFMVSQRITQEVFPEFDLDMILINVPYPGASPEEVEQGIVLSIEDNVRGLNDVKKVTAYAHENAGAVAVELLSGANTNKALQDVKNAVDRITTFPEDSERPVVSLIKADRMVLSLMVHGALDERTLRDLAERVRSELLDYKGITLVRMVDTRDFEIAIEVPQRGLRSFGLTLEQIAAQVRRTAIELPGGGLKTAAGEILLRTQERRDYASEFGDIPIVSHPDGSTVTLGEVAAISDGFEDSDKEARFNGDPAIRLDVYRVGAETPVGVSATVSAYLEAKEAELPAGMGIEVWHDMSKVYEARVALLLRNASLGLVLVLILLGLFLDARLAFWVTLGIPISILGAFIFIQFTGATINMISLFAFLVTLGIVVDDAIVVGENIYEKREQGLPLMDAATEGARHIAPSIVFAVLTNIAAFMPMFFVPGVDGNLYRQIPSVVVFVFLVSLIESLVVLPSHLAIPHGPNRFFDAIGRPQRFFSHGLREFIAKIYSPFLRLAITHRYATFALGVATLMALGGAMAGGHIPFTFFPKVDSDVVTVNVTLPFGTPMSTTREVRDKLLAAAHTAAEELEDAEIIQGIYAQIGTPPGYGGDPHGSHVLGMSVELNPPEERETGGVDFSKAWRVATGEIAGVESMSFDATAGMQGGAAIDIQLSHPERETLEIAAQELALQVSEYAGVSDIDNGVSRGKPQLSFTLRPEARSLGISSADLARQVRSSFFGVDALRQQRGRNEVKVRVRLPEEERETLSTLSQLTIQTSGGGEIPFYEAVETERGRSYTQIRRVNGQRVISVTADVDSAVASSNDIIASLKGNELHALTQKYIGLRYSLEGEKANEQENLGALSFGYMLALFGIYALIAIPFNSYLQPIIVMLSIPFGVIGAILGHALLGYQISMISIFGIIALSGVVVNDSLVLIVTANENKKAGMSPQKAIYRAAKRRFRPILLTSLTTFFGLAPMIFETSMQARFLIPMAISIGFGVLFAAGIMLFLVPAIYMMLEDLNHAVAKRRAQLLGEAPTLLGTTPSYDPAAEPVGSSASLELEPLAPRNEP